MKYFLHFIIIAAILAKSSCTMKEGENTVSVTIEPQRYFAEKIAGDKFKIHTLVPSGQSPETYDPTPRQMINVSHSRAYLQIGQLGFEQAWTDNLHDINPNIRIFNLSQDFKMMISNHHDHHHNPTAHHHPGDTDPHIWSSINGAKHIALNTLRAFIAIDSANSDFYMRNYELLIEEINRTEAIILAKLASAPSRAFIIYHPSLSYFAEEFSLLQLCIENDGKEPSPTQIRQIVDMARLHNAKVAFIQQEFDSKNVERISEEAGCRTEIINPLNYHWDEELIRIAAALSDE